MKLRDSRSLGIALLCVPLLGAAGTASAEPSRLAAPNVVEISSQLVTSGQPSREALAQLSAMGFGAVISLVPADAHDAVRDEPQIVTRQNIIFVNIPVQFDNPTAADFDVFASVLQGLSNRKVLVHCQINLRASSMVFLYRTLVLKEPPAHAYEALSGIWKPEGPWRRLIEAELRKHRIDFEML